jgi:FkbM family methyltransferase
MQLEKPMAHAADGWSMVKTGARRAWNWVTYPWTWSATQTANFVDAGPVGQQLRNLDGRAQVNSAAIEVISAQVSDIMRDQGQILTILDRQRGVFERLESSLDRLAEFAQSASKTNAETLQFAADIRGQLADNRSVPHDLTLARTELADGIKQVQLALAQEAASLRSRLGTLPSTEHVHALIGEGTVTQEFASLRAQFTDEIQKMQRALVEQTAGVHDRLATMPSTEHVHTLIGGGMVVDELSSARQELTDEIRRVHDALGQVTSSIDGRLAALPSAQQIHALIEGGVTQEFASAKTQLVAEIEKVRDALGEEFASARTQAAGEMQSLHQTFATHVSGVQERLAALPSAEQVQALAGGAMAHELASTRSQLAEGLQKLHQLLMEQTSRVHDRLAALPATEQIHAFVEGGTASSIQSTRRMLAEEAQRAQAAADRTAKKLEFLQSRNVIPLAAQGLVMCRNPLGFLAAPADDLATIGALADGVLPEQGTLKVVEKYLKAGGTFVDVGANVGLYSLLAARVVGPGGKVIAIEPAPAAAQALKATVHANGLSDIVSINEVAAGAEKGLGTLSIAQNSGHSTLLQSDAASGTVVAPIVTLDDMLDGEIPDMVKIDVEGWEPNVIEGMKAILHANPNIIVIMDFEPAHVRRTGLSAAAWVDRLLAAGLQIFEIDERNGELTPLRRLGLEEIVSINVLIARSDPSQRDASSATEDWLRLGVSGINRLVQG